MALFQVISAYKRVLTRVCQHPLAYRFRVARNMYWNLRAKGLDEEYGTATRDYDVLRDVLSSFAASRVLDIGCGSGRLFPLYRELGIGTVVGQDISAKALDLARERHDCRGITLLWMAFDKLAYPESHFDLVISNRVLQHIPPCAIESTVGRISLLARRVYICELSERDSAHETSYVFKHDYLSLFEHCGLSLAEEGLVGVGTWRLFVKNRFIDNKLDTVPEDFREPAH